MQLIPQILIPLVIIGAIVYLFVRRDRERTTNAPLRAEIEGQVCFETSLYRVSILGTGGFGGMAGYWFPLRGPKRLTVGTSAFMVSAPQALRQFVFTGRESSIEFARTPLRLGGRDHDCIIIAGEAGGREVQLAITQDNLPDIWQALAATGAALAGDAEPVEPLTRPWGRSVRAGGYSLGRLALALMIVLIGDAAVWLGAIARPVLALTAVANFVALVAIVMFLVWFYRARVNADGSGWPQRLAPGWAVWSWFIPVVNLWLPFQIMADIWRSSLPAEARANRATLPGIWWTSLLALFLLLTISGSQTNPLWYVLLLIKIAAVLAAIMTALLVRKVSSGPLERVAEPLIRA